MDAARHVQGIRMVARKPGGFTSLCGPAFGLLLCTETQPETLVGSFQTWVIIAALAKITAGFFSNFSQFEVSVCLVYLLLNLCIERAYVCVFSGPVATL